MTDLQKHHTGLVGKQVMGQKNKNILFKKKKQLNLCEKKKVNILEKQHDMAREPLWAFSII